MSYIDGYLIPVPKAEHGDHRRLAEMAAPVFLDHGGEESAFGAYRDKCGFSRQITPTVLTEAMADPDPAVRERVFAAMMTMRKTDIAGIEASRRG